jgi:hypothetical protein
MVPESSRLDPAERFAGDAYGPLILEQLTEERARKSSIEQRGLAVVSTAAGLVTALLALAGLITKRSDFHLSVVSEALLSIAALLLVAAAAAAVLTNAPRGYDEVSDAHLAEITAEVAWYKDVGEGARLVADLRRELVASARSQNQRKAKSLLAAIALEVVATMCVAATVLDILLR